MQNVMIYDGVLVNLSCDTAPGLLKCNKMGRNYFLKLDFFFFFLIALIRKLAEHCCPSDTVPWTQCHRLTPPTQLNNSHSQKM